MRVLIILLLFVNPCFGQQIQNHKKNMAILYTKKFDNRFTLELSVLSTNYPDTNLTDNVGELKWTTLLKDTKKNISYTLDSIGVIKERFAFFDKGPRYSLYIMDAYLDTTKNTVLVFYDCFGDIILSKYELLSPGICQKEAFLIGQHGNSSALGEFQYHAEFKTIGNNLWAYVHAKQIFGDNLIVENVIKFYDFDRIAKIDFNKKGKVVQFKKKEKDEYGDIEEIILRPMANYYLDSTSHIAKINDEIVNALQKAGKKGTVFYQGYLLDESADESLKRRDSEGIPYYGNAYFFYTINNKDSQIIRYDYYEAEWTIGNYEEVILQSIKNN